MSSALIPLTQLKGISRPFTEAAIPSYNRPVGKSPPDETEPKNFLLQAEG